MSDLDKRSDQAEGLRTKMIDEYKTEHGIYPPRSELHKGKDKNTKVKMKHPVISILALFFILLPVFILSINLYYGEKKEQKNNEETIIGEDRVYISYGQSADIDSDATNQSLDENEANSPDIEKENSTSGNEADEQTEPIENSMNEEDVTNKQDVSEVATTQSTNESSKTMDSKEQNAPVQYKEIKTHKVGAGETLFSIAIKYYNNRSGEDIIRQYNGFNGNEIYEGQILKIPIK